MTTKVPKTKARIQQLLRELAQDMDAPADWHYARIADGFARTLNTILAGLRTQLGEDDVPDDFAFSEQDYSATGKTVGQPAFDRLRRSVRSATDLAQSVETWGNPRPGAPAASDQLHPDIQRVSSRLMANGHASSAIFEAFKAVNARVKRVSGLEGEDGKSLMARAFAEDHPVLAINRSRNRSDRDEQEGFKLIFMGVMQGIRNPKAHEVVEEIDPARAREYLALASLLMRRLDDAEGHLSQG